MVFERIGLRKVNKGDVEFRRLYDENFDRVYSFVFSRTYPDLDATAEIVQDTFSAAWQAIDGFRGSSSAFTWLCSIAKHKLQNFYRAKTRHEKLFSLDEVIVEPSSEDDVVELVASKETRENVQKTLAALNPTYRFALILKYLDDCSVKEIARILGRTPKAVDGILQKSRYMFKKEFNRRVEGFEI